MMYFFWVSIPWLPQEALEQEGPVPLPAEAEAAEWWMQFVAGKKVCPTFISNLWIDVYALKFDTYSHIVYVYVWSPPEVLFHSWESAMPWKLSAMTRWGPLELGICAGALLWCGPGALAVETALIATGQPFHNAQVHVLSGRLERPSEAQPETWWDL